MFLPTLKVGSAPLTFWIRKKIYLLTKLTVAIFALMLFLGYQPALTFPPIKKITPQAKADFTVTPKVDSQKVAAPFNLTHPGYLSTPFSYWHPGIDIATGLGMPIHPISSGTVSEVTIGYFGLGHFVIITHSDGYQSTYGHMGRVFAKVGDPVTNGSIIGEVGMTGHTSGPHTHLEVMREGKYIDPRTVLPALSNFPEPQYLVGATNSKPVGGGEVFSSQTQAKPEEIKVDLKKELKLDL